MKKATELHPANTRTAPAGLRESVGNTLKQWVASSLTEFSQARAAPAAIYIDPDIFELELSELYSREWIMIGRAGQIPNHGDFFTYEIQGKSLIFIRQKDGTIKALANTCLHHYTSLLRGTGSKRTFSCPYHSWTYQCDGKLIGITEKKGFQQYNPSGCPSGRDRLKEYPCEIWHGFVFVSFNEDAEPVSSRLANLEKRISQYKFDEFEDLFLTVDRFDCNWKILVENFVESYHVPFLHRRTFGPLVPFDLMKYLPGDANFSAHVTPLDPELRLKILNRDVPEDDPNLLGDYGVFPNGLIGHHFDYLWWISVRPISVGEAEMRWGMSFHPNALANAPDPQAWMQEQIELVTQVLVEDRLAVEGVQRGARLLPNEEGCFFHEMERGTFEFQRYVASRLQRFIT